MEALLITVFSSVYDGLFPCVSVSVSEFGLRSVREGNGTGIKILADAVG